MELNKMNLKQLKEYAELNGLDIIKVKGKQNIIAAIQEQEEINKLMDNTEYVINYLINYSGATRNKALNITEGLFHNSTLAKKWYYKISKMIHPDICRLQGAENAFVRLQEIKKYIKSW